MTTKIEQIRSQLTTDEEREFFDRSIARLRTQKDGVDRISVLPVAQAVAILRQEMRQERRRQGHAVAPLTTRAPGFTCDDPNSLCDREGHVLEE